MGDDPRLDVLYERGIVNKAFAAPDFATRLMTDIDAADPLRRALTPGTDEYEAMSARAYQTVLDIVSVWRHSGGMIPVQRIVDAVLAALSEARVEPDPWPAEEDPGRAESEEGQWTAWEIMDGDRG